MMSEITANNKIVSPTKPRSRREREFGASGASIDEHDDSRYAPIISERPPLFYMCFICRKREFQEIMEIEKRRMLLEEQKMDIERRKIAVEEKKREMQMLQLELLRSLKNV